MGESAAADISTDGVGVRSTWSSKIRVYGGEHSQQSRVERASGAVEPRHADVRGGHILEKMDGNCRRTGNTQLNQYCGPCGTAGQKRERRAGTQAGCWTE